MRRTTVTNPPQREPKEQVIQLDISKQNDIRFKTTKSLMNTTDIFYSQEFDYKDYKQSLKYNNKNLKKIALENIKNPHPKIIRSLTKVNLQGLIELRLRDIDIKDVSFEIVGKLGGLNECFPNILVLQLNCPDVTNITLQHLFKSKQQLKQLDLSSTRIDNQGIQYISQFQWNQLDTLTMQWCSRVSTLSDMTAAGYNFPILKYLDCRFTILDNNAVDCIINSSISLHLTRMRVYGTKVDYSLAKWKSTYILEQLCNQLTGQQWSAITVTNTPCQNSTFKVDLNIVLGGDEKCSMNYSWALRGNIASIHLQEVPGIDKSEPYAKLFEFLGREWQLRDSLKYLGIYLNINCTDSNVTTILNNIIEFKQLTTIKFIMSKQKQIKPITYYYIFQQICRLQQINKLQIDLSNDGLIINDVFMNMLIKSIQQMPQLGYLYLNTMGNTIVDDVKYLINQIVTSRHNPWLWYIELMLTDQCIDYSMDDAIELYFMDCLKSICINGDMILSDGNQVQFKTLMMRMRQAKLRCLRSTQIANTLSTRFRKEIILELLQSGY